MYLSQRDTESPSSDEMADTKHLQELYNQTRQKNEKLLLELNSLRAQFNEATSIGTQLEQIHNQNSKLTSDLRKVTQEKDELSHRCELNIQVIEELRNSKEQEKVEMERRIQQEIGDARESFENEKKEMNESLSKAQSDLKDAQKLLKSSQNDCDSMAASIKNVIEAAQTYFLQPFKNIDQLADFLSKNKNNAQSNNQLQNQQNLNQPNPDQQNSQDELDNLRKQTKLLKQKLRDERKDRKEADGQVAKLENLLKNMKNQEDQNKKNFETSLGDLQKKLDLAELQRKTMATGYENKIAELAGLLEEEKSRSMQAANQVNSDSQNQSQIQSRNVDQLKNKIASSANKLKEMQALILALRKQNSQFLSQLNESENSKELLRRKYQSATEENEKLRASLDKAKLEISTISIERDDLKEQNDTILSQIQAARSSYNQSKAAYSEAECQIEKLQSSLALLEGIVNKQKDEIIENITARNKYVTSLHKQNDALHQMENLLSNLSEENKSLKAKIDHATVNRDINQKLNPVNSGNNSASDNSSIDGIPITSWFCMEFPKQLKLLISEIANNTALATTTKLRNVLSTIAKYYNKQIDQLKNAIQENDEKVQANNEQLGNLFNSLGQFVNDSSLTAESFNNDPVRKTQNIMNALADIQNSQIDSKLQKTQLQNETADLLKKLNATTMPQAISTVDDLNDQIKKLKEQNEAGKAKFKKLSKTLKALKNAAQQDADDSQLQIESQTGEIKKLQDDNKRLQDQNKHYENVIDQLSSQINGSSLSLLNGNTSQQQQPIVSRDANLNDLSMSTPGHSQNREKANQAQNAQLIKALKDEIESQKANYGSMIADKDNQINDLKDKLDNYEKELQQMRKIAEILKSSKNDKDQQIQNLMNEIDNRDKENRDRLEKEKESLQQQYERSITQLKGKNTQLRDLISNVSNALNESEERNKNLLAANSQLSIEKQQVQARLETINEEIKRDKQLSEARLKTVELAMSTQMQIEIEEEHSKCDEQKRQIYSYVANKFMMFFDATKNFINEEGFRILVDKCSNELRRLTKMESSLRRILGLHVNESIEDAVSKILVSIYKH